MIVYQVRIDPDKPDMSVWTDRDEAVEWAKADWKERCGEEDYEPVENEDFLIESLIVNLPECFDPKEMLEAGWVQIDRVITNANYQLRP